MALQLTTEEIERYRPYHLWPAFEFGFNDYNDCRDRYFDPNTPAGQAYDRGAECAMERSRVRQGAWRAHLFQIRGDLST